MDAKLFLAAVNQNPRSRFSIKKNAVGSYALKTRGPIPKPRSIARLRPELKGQLSDAEIDRLFEAMRNEEERDLVGGRPEEYPGGGRLPVPREVAFETFRAVGLKVESDGSKYAVKTSRGKKIFEFGAGESIATDVVGLTAAAGIFESSVEPEETKESLAEFNARLTAALGKVETGRYLNPARLIEEGACCKTYKDALPVSEELEGTLDRYLQGQQEGQTHVARRTDYERAESGGLVRVYELYSKAGTVKVSVLDPKGMRFVTFASVRSVAEILRSSGPEGQELAERFTRDMINDRENFREKFAEYNRRLEEEVEVKDEDVDSTEKPPGGPELEGR